MNVILVILRDPVWQFIGAICSIGALVFTIVTSLKNKNRKAIAYSIVSDEVLSNINDIPGKKFEIRYDNIVVGNVRQVVVKVWNSGNVAITPNDFYECITVEFSKNVEILEAIILSHTNFQPIYNLSSLRIPEMLLNQGDSMKIKIFLTGLDKKIEVKGKIIGIKQIVEIKQTKQTLMYTFPMICVVLGIVILVLAYSHFFLMTLAIFLLIIIIIWLCIFIFFQSSYKYVQVKGSKVQLVQSSGLQTQKGRIK